MSEDKAELGGDYRQGWSRRSPSNRHRGLESVAIPKPAVAWLKMVLAVRVSEGGGSCAFLGVTCF